MQPEAARAPNSALEEFSQLLSLAFPIALTQFAIMGLSLVDTAIVGKTSPIDLAGVSLARSVLFALAAFGIGIAITLEPIASQALGAKEPDRAWGAFRNTLRAAAILAPPTFVLSLVLIRVMPVFGIDRLVALSAERFLYGNCLTIFFFIAFSVSRIFLQAHGKTAHALFAALFANVVNFFTCHFFVRGDAALVPLSRMLGKTVSVGMPPMGAFGAGLAGSLSTVLLVLILEVFARRERVTGPNPSPSPVRILRMALPVGLQVLAEIGVFSVAAFLSARLGATALSAHQVALGLASFTFMGALGIGGATSIRVGRAVGEGRSPRRAGFVGICAGGTFMLIGTFTFTFYARELVSLFTNDSAVRDLAVSLVRIAAVFQFFDGIQVVAASALRGAGDFRFPFLANVFAHWCFGFPMALVLGVTLGGGARGIWWGLTTGLVVISVLLSIRFERLSRRAIARL